MHGRDRLLHGTVPRRINAHTLSGRLRIGVRNEEAYKMTYNSAPQRRLQALLNAPAESLKLSCGNGGCGRQIAHQVDSFIADEKKWSACPLPALTMVRTTMCLAWPRGLAMVVHSEAESLAPARQGSGGSAGDRRGPEAAENSALDQDRKEVVPRTILLRQ